MPKITVAGELNADLLGGGMDITGRDVEAFGQTWTVIGRNYLGDWDVERFEHRPEGRFKITSSIAPETLPETNGHYARLVSNS